MTLRFRKKSKRGSVAQKNTVVFPITVQKYSLQKAVIIHVSSIKVTLALPIWKNIQGSDQPTALTKIQYLSPILWRMPL